MEDFSYEFVLALHSSLRWLVLLLLVVGLVRAVVGALTDSKKGAGSKAFGVVTIISLDVQILVGLALHLFISPTTKNAMADMGAAMKDPEQRFWVVEHGAMMILAAVFVHGCRMWAKRARSDRSEDFRLAVGYLIGLALILVRTPWPFTAIERPWFRLPF